MARKSSVQQNCSQYDLTQVNICPKSLWHKELRQNQNDNKCSQNDEFWGYPNSVPNRVLNTLQIC